jgi:XTP/dITP diphosphohydrolase
MKTLVIATHNPKKGKELRRLLGKVPFHVRMLSDFPGAPKVREDATTFQGNALKKALSAVKFTGCWALADDSGLEVDSLAGRPGIRTARFARRRGRESQDAANNRKLLKALKGVANQDRGALFRCVIALVTPTQKSYFSEGILRGHIAYEMRGHSGFGYDPLFVITPPGKTIAQLGRAVKGQISHRAIAVKQVKKRLLQKYALSR